MSGDPLAWIETALRKLESEGLRRTIVTLDREQGPVIEIAGQELVNFGSNDYLSLAADTRLASAAMEAAQRDGWGAGASPLITGHARAHRELELRIAEFEATEAAILFSSGFAANVGTIAALVGRGDIVFGDEKNHASIIDGCRISRAEVQVYKHNDVDHLENLLRSSAPAARKLVVSDTLFSMDGDRAPLTQLCDLAEQYDCMLMVDEAHATGVFGEQGRGLVEELGLESRVHVRVGTLSKALGCAGGFVVGSEPLVHWLANRARPYVFSTAHPPAGSAAAIAALNIVRDEPHRRTGLLERAKWLRSQLVAQGWDCGTSASQIIPVLIGGADATMSLAQKLRDQGFFVPGIRPPSVPNGQSLLRISLCYGHTQPMLDALLSAMQKLRAAV